jgi:hypothetical protein
MVNSLSRGREKERGNNKEGERGGEKKCKKTKRRKFPKKEISSGGKGSGKEFFF